MIVAIVPAHNEAGGIANTITSLSAQVDAVWVSADNCTDDTVRIATNAGAHVFETVDNTDKKAGALNQLLRSILPGLNDTDFIFAVDADTTVSPTFVERAMREFADPLVGAVGGVFYGEQPTSLLERIQANEYVRYARQLDRTGRTMVLSGTAAIIRVQAVREILATRGSLLPTAGEDNVYKADALTEDMEIGLALKTLGWKLKSPIECSCTTELMPTRKALMNQRIRWYRGAVENLVDYGITRVTFRYWVQQVSLVMVTLFFAAYLAYTSVVVSLGMISVDWFWLSIGLIFVLERVVTAWKAGWAGRFIAVSMILEMLYDITLQIAFVRALVRVYTNKEAEWLHEGGVNV